jgi:DNA-damage-inducible protein J
MATEMLHVRVDEQLKADAAATLQGLGLTISDAVRILLARIVRDGGIPPELTIDQTSYDAWFTAKVQKAIVSANAGHLIHDEAVKAKFAEKRAATLQKIKASR